ncbi:MAG: thiamine phosphate synthase [Candidatus Omnitrophica bacterium]|nr:thiamine phosphate synthase [Candidatus Omnitrophota bacterium]
MIPFRNKKNLYLVTSQEYCLQKTTLEVAREAIAGGIDIIQMREKTFANDELIKLGKELSTLSKKHNIVFIANDDPCLAKEINADGVHLGQSDILKHPIYKVRELLGKDKIIGVSTHCLEQVKEANSLDIDYIAYGPIYKTKTKDYTVGPEKIEDVIKTSRFPVVFIGGINKENIRAVLKRGARNMAMIREISESPDIKAKIKELKEIINEYNN